LVQVTSGSDYYQDYYFFLGTSPTPFVIKIVAREYIEENTVWDDCATGAPPFCQGGWVTTYTTYSPYSLILSRLVELLGILNW
jgi:hypothetical protein